MMRPPKLLLFINGVTFVCAIGWLVDQPSLETAVAALTLLATLAGLIYAERKPTQIVSGQGGRGGSAKVGGNGIAIGGLGGGAGAPGGGSGGSGGDAEVVGDGFAMGGEGGEAGQADRGGRGGRSPFEILGIPNDQLPDGRWLWEIGRGGDGGGPQRQGTEDQVASGSTTRKPSQ